MLEFTDANDGEHKRPHRHHKPNDRNPAKEKGWCRSIDDSLPCLGDALSATNDIDPDMHVHGKYDGSHQSGKEEQGDDSNYRQAPYGNAGEKARIGTDPDEHDYRCEDREYRSQY